MKHQDPLSPMNADQMAAQLAQFSTVEQLTSLNDKMDGQQEAQAAIVGALHATTAMGALGKTVVAEGDQVRVGEDGRAAVTVKVADPGGSGTLTVFDEKGKQVASLPLGSVPGGKQSFELGGAGLPPGRYTYAVQVHGASGEEVAVQTYTTGRIDGVRYGKDGPILTSGPLTIRFGSVVEIAAGS